MYDACKCPQFRQRRVSPTLKLTTAGSSATARVVVAARDDFYSLFLDATADTVNDAVVRRDPPGPPTGEIAAERFGFADPFGGASPDIRANRSKSLLGSRGLHLMPRGRLHCGLHPRTDGARYRRDDADHDQRPNGPDPRQRNS